MFDDDFDCIFNEGILKVGSFLARYVGDFLIWFGLDGINVIGALLPTLNTGDSNLFLNFLVLTDELSRNDAICVLTSDLIGVNGIVFALCFNGENTLVFLGVCTAASFSIHTVVEFCKHSNKFCTVFKKNGSDVSLIQRLQVNQRRPGLYHS